MALNRQAMRQHWQRRSELLRRQLVVFWLRATDRPHPAQVVMVDGQPLLHLPKVFSPQSFTTALVLRNRQRLQGQRVLEVGCGAGALATLAGPLTRTFVATDISPEAVHNTRLNAQWHGASQVTVLQADVLSGVAGTFDLVVFNAPFFPGRARNEADRKWLGDDGRVLTAFLGDVRRVLAQGGKIWLTHSDVADETAFFALLRQHDMNWRQIDARDIWIETFKLYEVVPADSHPIPGVGPSQGMNST